MKAIGSKENIISVRVIIPQMKYQKPSVELFGKQTTFLVVFVEGSHMKLNGRHCVRATVTEAIMRMI